MNKSISTFIFILLISLLGATNAWGADTETIIATFSSADVVDNTTYTEYENDDWYLSKGGNNSSGGYNKNNVTEIDNVHGTAAKTTDYGFYIESKNKINNISKVTFSYTGGSGITSGTLYLAYSTDGISWTSLDSKSISSTTSYTFEFIEVASAYYAIVVSHGTTGGVFRFDGITADFIQVESGTKYTVTYSNGGHGTAPSSASAASVTLPELEAEGYNHTGWKADRTVKVGGVDKSAGTLLENGAKATLTANTTFTAQWEVETYTITLTKSSYDCATDGSITIQYNATEPTSFTPATRTGYAITNKTGALGGYCSAPSGGIRVFNPDGTFASDNVSGFITNGKWTNTSKTLVLHPRWEENCSNMVNVSVNVSGGHGTATANKTSVSTCSCTNGDRLVKITATPETGYVVENITWATTSGTVTATKQDGNSGKTIWSFYFAQDNSGAGTFTVTFVEQKKYHITFINNLHGGSTSTSAECDENVSTSITFPSISDATESTGTTCEEEHFHFVGWVKNGQAVTDANIKKAGSNTVKLTSNETYYAVWAKKVTGTGNSYKILTSSDDITTGDYVIATMSGDYAYPMGNTLSSKQISGTASVDVTNSTTISNPAAQYIWTITKNSSNQVSLYNAAKSSNKYLNIIADGKYGQLAFEGTAKYYTYTKSGSPAKWIFNSVNISGQQIEYYNSAYKSYSSQGENIYLFRREDSYGDYVTSCAPPTTWSVVYDANGKTLSPGVSLPDAVTDIEESEAFTVPTNNYVSSPDYAQIGWNTDATATTGLTTVPGQTAGTVVTLYAIWQKSQVEVVEVTGTNDIIIEHNFGGNTGAELDKWATGTELKKADEPFISKYFEATGSVKLIGIFNGTGADIDPKNLRLRVVSNRVASNIGTSKDSTKIINLSTYRTEAMPSGTEYILYSHDTDDERDQRIMNCVKGLDGINMTDWIEISWTTYSPTLAALTFGGADAVVLEQKDGSTWKILDIVGALRADGKSVDPSNLKSNSTITWGDAGSGGKNRGWYCADGQDLDSIANEPRKSLELATLRCLLVRKPSVVSGAKTRTASGNLGSGNFNTLCSEWYGKHVELANEEKTTCDAFAEVGSFNYKESYEKYITVTPDQFTATNNTDGTMTIHIDPDKVDGGLASLSCDMLKIKVTDNTTGDVLGQVEYKVPIIVAASNTETNDAIFTKFDDCSTCDVVILQNATLAPNASGKNTLRDLEIYRGAKLNVPSTQTLTVNNLIMRSKGDVTPQADILGTLNRKDTKLYFDKRVDENQWYWIALPYDCNMADVTFRNGDKPTYGVGKDWVLKTYNGVKRANTQAGGCWETVPENSTLKAGVGYILGITPKAGHAYVEIRFPMTAEDWDKDRATVTVPVKPTASEGITPNHVGWNLVGNPYLTNYAPGYVGMDNADNTHNLIPLGLLQENAENEYERVGSTRYVVIPQNGGYSEYKQVAIGDQKLPTFMSYFIQIDGNVGTNYAVDFKYANSHYAASPMRRAPEEYMEEPEDNHPVWVPVTLANVKGEKDETTFLISNQFTDNYDMMDDLIKWRGDYYQYPSITTKPVLASRNTAAELAFNALPDSSAWRGIPLNYFASTAGMYTIALSAKYGLDEVAEAFIYDASTKVRHDLKTEAYTFSTDRTDNTDRFTLYVRVERKKAPEVATDVDNLQAGDKPQKVLVNGNVYILRGGKVFDITGKQVR